MIARGTQAFALVESRQSEPIVVSTVAVQPRSNSNGNCVTVPAPEPRRPRSGTVDAVPVRVRPRLHRHVDTTIGSDCPLSTSANALVPGAITAGLRAIWQLGQAQVYDGGPDGNPVSADNTLFLDQGVFVP